MSQINIAYETLKVAKIFIITIFTYYTAGKIMNKSNKEKKVITILVNIAISTIYYFLRDTIRTVPATALWISLLSIYIAKNTKKSIGYTVLCTATSLAINNILFAISSIIIFIPAKMLNITNEYLIVAFMSIIYTILVCLFLKIKKIKNGFDFFNTNLDNEYFEIMFFNITAITLIAITLISNYDKDRPGDLLGVLIIFSIIMFITIQKSLQLYYKQKLLEQELTKVKTELEAKTKEVEELEVENIRISKNAHTLDHKQKSLAKKIDEMMLKTEISVEEAAEVRNRLEQIGKDLYKEKTTIELDKTEIPEIDDMLKYMQSECIANKIDFELQLKGNIHHMTNNLISKEDLETLLADHIKNAIIAINHTDNTNRSILVKLGKIDETYGLYIYDSGIEFEKETLANLGKKPSTTHKGEGGTGMGFMNTFDTLNKCNASLVIERFGKPNKENYTKVIMFKFDNKNEFKIK